MACLKWSMNNIFGCKPGEVFFSGSDVGWVVGHSYSVYAPLLNGSSSILFEGKPIVPDPGVVWRVCAEYGVKSMFTSPTAMRAIKKEDSEGDFVKKHDLSKLKHIFIAGERCDVETLHWIEKKTGKEVIDHWWQTETGFPITAKCVGLDAKRHIKEGSANHPGLFYTILVSISHFFLY